MNQSRIGVGIFHEGQLAAFCCPNGNGSYTVHGMYEHELPQGLIDDIARHAAEKLSGYETYVRDQANRAYPTENLPTEPGQYLFAFDDGPLDLWSLTSNGWYASNNCYYKSPLDRRKYITWQAVVRGSL